jgi:hypothetical protein
MAGISTGVSLLSVTGTRSLTWDAPTFYNTTLPIADSANIGRILLTDGRTYTRKGFSVDTVDGTWATPVGSGSNPEGYEYRWIQVSGSPLLTTSSTDGQWIDASAPLVMEISASSGSGTTLNSSFTLEIRLGVVTLLTQALTISVTRV